MTDVLLGAIIGLLWYGVWKISAQLEYLSASTNNVTSHLARCHAESLEELERIRNNTKKASDLLYLISNASDSKEISDEKDKNRGDESIKEIERLLNGDEQMFKPKHGVDEPSK